MKTFQTLILREWLQHRFGWSLLVLIPLVLAVLLLSFGEIQIDPETMRDGGRPFATLLVMASMLGGAALILLAFWTTSFILMTGLARRDQADRSHEFWLSLPVGHAPSLAAPMLTHFVLVPIAALLMGALAGWAVSLLLVSRLAGIGAWFSVPWGSMGAVLGAGLLRGIVGLMLATLWLSPLLMLTMLMTAWFRRWGIVVLAVGLGLGGLLLQEFLHTTVLNDTLAQLLSNAGRALALTGPVELQARGPEEVDFVLSSLPGLLLADLGKAIALLAQPLLAGALLVAAACFAGLVQWRRGSS